jgi:3-dehydroquinate synthetase
MRAASRISERLGLLGKADREVIESAISRVGRLPRANNLALGDIISAMHRDKKAQSGKLTFVLPVEIGRVVVKSDVPLRVVRAAIKDALS